MKSLKICQTNLNNACFEAWSEKRSKSTPLGDGNHTFSEHNFLHEFAKKKSRELGVRVSVTLCFHDLF